VCTTVFYHITCLFSLGLYAGTTFSVPSSLHTELLWQVGLFNTLPFAIIQWASRYADEMIAAIYDGVVEPLIGAIFHGLYFGSNFYF